MTREPPLHFMTTEREDAMAENERSEQASREFEAQQDRNAHRLDAFRARLSGMTTARELAEAIYGVAEETAPEHRWERIERRMNLVLWGEFVAGIVFGVALMLLVRTVWG